MSESRHGMSIGNLSPSKRKVSSRKKKYSMSVINITSNIMACSILVLFLVKHQLSLEDAYYPKGPQPKSINLEPINCNTISKESADKINKKFTENGSLNGDHINGFWISIHNKKKDRARWLTIMNHGTYYEYNLTRHFHKILKEERNNMNSIVIDIGMNIGWYSLLSASYNVSLIGFEPNMMHHSRMCESLDLNGWNTENNAIELYPYGIGDISGLEIFSYFKRQPGTGRIIPEVTKEMRKDNKKFVNEQVKMITLDDFAFTKKWFETNIGFDNNSRQVQQRQSNVAILKVDVESFEKQVFRGASYFLHAGLAKHIFCEVTMRPIKERIPAVKMIVGILHENGYYVKHILDRKGTPFEETEYWIETWSYPHPNSETLDYAEEVKNLIFDAFNSGYGRYFNLWFTRM